jgi:DNA-binding GntR family transcriptional regulator
MQKDKVAKHVKEAIIKGNLEPGQRIVEASLCNQYNVGRSKVRDALKQLEQEGYIEITPNVGAVVKEISQKDVAQIYDLMSVLEGLSMRIATLNLTDEQITKLEEINTKMEENEKNKFLLSQYNYEFHVLLTKFGGNSRLIAFMDNIRSQTYQMRLKTFYNEEQVQATLKEHRAIIKAIKERKPQHVENLIRNHYIDAKNRLIKDLNATL